MSYMQIKQGMDYKYLGYNLFQHSLLQEYRHLPMLHVSWGIQNLHHNRNLRNIYQLVQVSLNQDSNSRVNMVSNHLHHLLQNLDYTFLEDNFKVSLNLMYNNLQLYKYFLLHHLLVLR